MDYFGDARFMKFFIQTKINLTQNNKSPKLANLAQFVCPRYTILCKNWQVCCPITMLLQLFHVEPSQIC